MKCAWQAYLSLLPHWMRQDVDNLGKDSLQELRLKVGHMPQLCLIHGTKELSRAVSKDDIAFVINAASAYSPWAAGTLARGYLTAPGGHRIGVCGVAIVQNRDMTGISDPTSLCVRVARDFYGIAKTASKLKGSILIIGPPGSGKTTLLRDLIRQKSDLEQECVSVVDERQEIFPLYKGQACFHAGGRTDVLSGCPKVSGIEATLRSMNPMWIAVDEITAQEDADALLHAGWCGVNLLATAHAGTLSDLKTRPVYQLLVQHKLFENVLILGRDKSWVVERII